MFALFCASEALRLCLFLCACACFDVFACVTFTCLLLFLLCVVCFVCDYVREVLAALLRLLLLLIVDFCCVVLLVCLVACSFESF